MLLICILVILSPLHAQPNTGPLISDLDWSDDDQQLAAAFGRWEVYEEFGSMTPRLLTEPLNGIYLLRWQTGQGEFLPLVETGYSATTVDFHPNGGEIAYTSNNSFGVMELEPRRVRLEVLSGAPYSSLIYNAGGTVVLGTRLTASGLLYSNDILDGPGAGIGQDSLPGIVYPFLYSVWVGEDRAATSAVDGRIYVWQGLDILRVFEGHTTPVRRLVWNAATNLIASGDDSGRVLVWNPDTADVVQELTGHTGPILDIDWRPDGEQIATASQDGTLRVWDWPSGSTQIVDTANVFSAVAYSPDGSQLAYGGEVIDPNNVQIDIVPVSELVPTPSPTPTPTPAPTQAALQRVRLTSMCSANPAAYRVWRVRSTNPYDVVVDWSVYNSATGQAGFVVVPPAQGSTPGEITFITQTEPGPNTVRIFVNGVLQDTKASNPAPC
jgi:hypothetical protein